jgi:hypothetical protein
VPTAVFSNPPIGTVGLTEEQAREQYGDDVDIYTARFRPMKNTLSGRDERTLMKLVVDGKSDRVLGCHMLGPDAPEIIQGLAIAVKCGASKRMFDQTVGIHPSAGVVFVTRREKKARPQKAAGELRVGPASRRRVLRIAGARRISSRAHNSGLARCPIRTTRERRCQSGNRRRAGPRRMKCCMRVRSRARSITRSSSAIRSQDFRRFWTPLPNVEPDWLPVEAVVDANRSLVAVTGERHLLRDVGLLESALARPQNAFAYGETDLIVLAVRLMAGIAQSHAFRGTSEPLSPPCDCFCWQTASIWESTTPKRGPTR